MARIGEESIRARAEHGTYIAEGAAVEVVSVEFGEVVVRAAAGVAQAGREQAGGTRVRT
jgi:membrane-bound ClpP family serine protease